MIIYCNFNSIPKTKKCK